MTTYYPIVSFPQTEDVDWTGYDPETMPPRSKVPFLRVASPDFMQAGVYIVAITSNETRFPKAGEYFLSGSIVEAYRAARDLNCEYRIAKLVLVRVSITVDRLR